MLPAWIHSVTTSKLDRTTVYRRIKHAVRLTQDGRYADALPLFQMYLPLLERGNEDERRLLTKSSSFCGLSLAMVKHRFSEALEYCRISLNGDFGDPDHRANLALVYLERNDRRNAVKHLYAGLRVQPGHPRINRILESIGWRRKPPIRFLSRDHPINVWLGKRRSRRSAGQRGRRSEASKI